MRRIILKSLAAITLVVLIALAWVGAGERLSLFLNRFQTVGLASLSTQPLSAYNGKEGTYYAGAFFIGKEEMPTTKRSDWMAFPLTLYGDHNQLHLSTGGKSFTFGPLLETTRDDVGRVVFAFASLRSRRIKFRLPSKGACSVGPHLLRSIS